MKQGQRLKDLAIAIGKLGKILHKDYYFNNDAMPACVKYITWRQRKALFASGLNIFRVPASPYGYPPSVQFELTNYCNLQCPVCPTGKGLLNRKPQNMSVKLFKQAWEELSPHITSAVLWNWGEPLLHPEIKEILRIAHSGNVATYLSTNGQNLNDEKIINALLCYPPQYLILAIDGITDETNSKFRVGAKLEPILEGVRQLALRRYYKYPILHLRYIVMKHNEHELSELDRWARDNYFDSLSLRTLSIIDDNEDTHKFLKPDNPKYRAYEYDNGERVVKKDFICDKMVTFPCISINGEVTPCEEDYNLTTSFGNVNEHSFKNIWFGDKARDIRQQILTAPDSFSFCHNCPFRDRPTSFCSVEYHDLKETQPLL
jgi:radical SAM protein with 4Fe4S-binding SPASM domain